MPLAQRARLRLGSDSGTSHAQYHDDQHGLGKPQRAVLLRIATRRWRHTHGPLGPAAGEGGRDAQTARRVRIPPKLSGQSKVKRRNPLNWIFLEFVRKLFPGLTGTDIWIREKNPFQKLIENVALSAK